MNQPAPVAHSARPHAWAPPSAAHRWAGYLDEKGCPGSLALCDKAIKKPEGADAKEGTKGHQLLQVCLENRLFDCRHYILAAMYADELLNSVNVCLKFVGAIVQLLPDIEIHCETEAYVTPEYWGHNDIVLYHRATGQLWIIDFKNGKWPVKVIGNPQLLSYLLGIVDKFPGASNFTVAIVQPRRSDGGKAVQDWAVSRYDLERWSMQAAQALKDSHANPPIYRPSPERCRYCEGAYACPAVMQAPTNAPGISLGKAPRKQPGKPKEERPLLNEVGQRISLQEVNLSELIQVGAALTGLPVVKSYVKNIEDLGNELGVKHQLPIPGFKLCYKKESIKWDADWRTIANMLWSIAGISPAEVMPQSLIAITTAKELLTAALKERDPGDKATPAAIAQYELDCKEAWAKFATLTTRVQSDNIELVPESDPRPPFQAMADHKAGFDKIVYIPTE